MPSAVLIAPSHVAGDPLVSVIQNGLLYGASLSLVCCQWPVRPWPAMAVTHDASDGSCIVGSTYHFIRSSKIRSSGMMILLVTPAAANFVLIAWSVDLSWYGLYSVFGYGSTK